MLTWVLGEEFSAEDRRELGVAACCTSPPYWPILITYRNLPKRHAPNPVQAKGSHEERRAAWEEVDSGVPRCILQGHETNLYPFVQAGSDSPEHRERVAVVVGILKATDD